MSDGLIIGILTILGSALATYLTYRVSMWINKRKVPVEINQIKADTNLSEGELIEKYQSIASKQADENLELIKENNTMKGEKKDLMAALQKLHDEMMSLDEKHNSELKELNHKVDLQIKENEKLRDWVRRLILQLESWNIVPVPFDIEEAKKNGLALGEFGINKTSKIE